MTLLPPKYVNVPVEIIYTSAIPPALRDTWIQLRGLAWQQNETPEMKVSELASILHKSESTIYGHLSRLHNYSLLLLEKTATGMLRVSFNPADDVSKILEMLNSTKKQELENNNNNTKPKNTAFQKSGSLYTLALTIAEVCHVDLELNKGKFFKAAKKLASAGYTYEQVADIYGPEGRWYRMDWRGQRGSKPNIASINDSIRDLNSIGDTRQRYAEWDAS